MRPRSDTPNAEQLRQRFTLAIADARQGILSDDCGLGRDVDAALVAIADAAPHIPPALEAAAEAAFERYLIDKRNPRPPHL